MAITLPNRLDEDSEGSSQYVQSIARVVAQLNHVELSRQLVENLCVKKRMMQLVYLTLQYGLTTTNIFQIDSYCQ